MTPTVSGTATTVSLHLEDGREIVLLHAEGNELAAALAREVRQQANAANWDRIGAEHEAWLERSRAPVAIKEGV